MNKAKACKIIAAVVLLTMLIGLGVGAGVKYIHKDNAVEVVGQLDQNLSAAQYFAYDVQKEQFLFLSGQAEDVVYPASITKLFTAYVALQYLDAEQMVVVGEELDMVSPGSSVANLREGDQLTVSQLVEAMLLPSGNDAAYVLAAAAGREIWNGGAIRPNFAVDVFVDKMNEQLQQVGMTGSCFQNPDGIHSEDHYSTIADMVILASLAVDNEIIMRYASTSSDTITIAGREPENWKNTNGLIDPNSVFYCPYATGLKTGQTPAAGSCLLSSFVYEGKLYFIGVFGCAEKDDRFRDTLILFNEIIS